jgi:hypothetical protein
MRCQLGSLDRRFTEACLILLFAAGCALQPPVSDDPVALATNGVCRVWILGANSNQLFGADDQCVVAVFDTSTPGVSIDNGMPGFPPELKRIAYGAGYVPVCEESVDSAPGVTWALPEPEGPRPWAMAVWRRNDAAEREANAVCDMFP